MVSYILRRMMYMIPTIILISIISFLIIQAPPGDFLTSQIQELEQLSGEAAERQIKALRKRYGLDKPIHLQYWLWIRNIILRGDFGQSLVQQLPVLEILKQRLPVTILITSLTIIFQFIVSIPIGIYSAVKKHTFFDYIFTFLAFIGRSIPNFLLALILMYIFYANFDWSLGGLFSTEYQSASWDLFKLLDLAKHLILPIIVIGTAGTAGLVRVLRGTMLDELGKQYVQTARSKGLSERKLILTHPTKVALLPIISTIGWLLPRVISGGAITAIVLNLPTTGSALFSALQTQDMYVAGSFILLLSIMTVIGTLISDILLAQIDPRIRYD